MPDLTGAEIAVPAELEGSGPKILAIASQIEAELADLKRLLLPLHDYWVGDAKEDWHLLQLQWDVAAADLMASQGTLGDIGRTATVNWGNYIDCEAANVRTWAH
jgi:uncharacterized protein YukE